MKCYECERTVPQHKWGQIKAHDEGWYFPRNGGAYCPDHVPAWVTEWRARNG